MKKILSILFVLLVATMVTALSFINTDLQEIKINEDTIDLDSLFDYAGYSRIVYDETTNKVWLDVVYLESDLSEWADFQFSMQGEITKVKGNKYIITPTVANLNWNNILDDVNKVEFIHSGKDIWKINTDIEDFESMKFKFYDKLI